MSTGGGDGEVNLIPLARIGACAALRIQDVHLDRLPSLSTVGLSAVDPDPVIPMWPQECRLTS